MRALLFLLAAGIFAAAGAPPEAGYPKRAYPYVIHDGDTFVGARGNTVYRLWGVDAPEIDQPWGEAARAALEALIRKRAVTLVSHHGETYGRPVVLVTVRKLDVGLEMLKMGLAWHDPRYAPDKPEYAAAMAEARAAGRGLWSDRAPVSPWEWRAKKHYEIIDEED